MEAKGDGSSKGGSPSLPFLKPYVFAETEMHIWFVRYDQDAKKYSILGKV